MKSVIEIKYAKRELFARVKVSNEAEQHFRADNEYTRLDYYS